MSFLCGEGPRVVRECEPTCSRWASVNEGETIKLFHDPSNWDPNLFNFANAPDPIVYLQEAMQVWNDAYPCGTLFEIVDTRAEASVIVDYDDETGENVGFLGFATCFCDEDDDVCVQQVDQSAFFSPARPAELTIVKNDFFINQPPERLINTYLHELGHILGMGHIYGRPEQSIMGNNPNAAQSVSLYGWDLEQLDARHPCGCTIVQPQISPFLQEVTRRKTKSFCPGCRVPK